MKKFKRALALGLASVMILAVAACGGNDVSTSNVGLSDSTSEAATSSIDMGVHTWKIGGIAPVADDAANYGTAMQNGAQIAVDEINMTGGINGAMIEYVFEEGNLKEEKDNLFVLSLTESTIDIIIDQTNVYQISTADRKLDETDDATVSFIQMHQVMYGEVPNVLAASAYDGIYILKAAIEASGVTADMSTSEIKDAIVNVMPTISWDGLTGTDM